MYQEILQKKYASICKVAELSQGWMFQQDDDPKHTVVKTKEWFQRKKVKVLEWPSQSPDLNPIENLCKELKIKVHMRNSQILCELKTICQQEWKKIDSDFCKKLTSNYCNR